MSVSKHDRYSPERQSMQCPHGKYSSSATMSPTLSPSAVSRCRRSSRSFDVLVAEDARHDLIVGVHPDIAAADTGGYDAQQTASAGISGSGMSRSSVVFTAV